MTLQQQRRLSRLSHRFFADVGENAEVLLLEKAVEKAKNNFLSAQGYLNSWNSLKVRGDRGDTGCEDRFASVLASAGVGCPKRL